MPAVRSEPYRKVNIVVTSSFVRRLAQYPGERVWKIEILCKYAVALGALATDKLPSIKKRKLGDNMRLAAEKRWALDKGEEEILAKEQIHAVLPESLLKDLTRYSGEQSEKIEALCRFALDEGAMMSMKECEARAAIKEQQAKKLKLEQPKVFEGL